MEKRITPYNGKASRYFWSRAVAPIDQSRDLVDLYTPRFSIKDLRVLTAGSCFAQHIAHTLRRNGFHVIDKEPPPRWLRREDALKFGYLQYSARYGNIYTVRRLLQLTQEAFQQYHPSEQVWQRGARFFDALRPQIEPDGFNSPQEVLIHRHHHLDRFRLALQEADLIVFTFGLTEAWTNSEGLVFCSAPGVEAGSYDPGSHSFVNFDYSEVLKDFLQFRDFAKSMNPSVKFILTVSPVPLSATATQEHVLTATIRSKAILRAVAGTLYETYIDIDYFPSYELISTPFFKNNMFEPNKRDVRKAAVDGAMRLFLDAHFGRERSKHASRPRSARRTRSDVVCEEALLDAFAP